MTYGFGAPEGGVVVPSRSDGRIASSLELSKPVLTKVAGLPASIAVRLNANGCGPRKELPELSNTFALS